MSIFKKFFEKKKLDNKFKHAGQGHLLADTETAGSGSSREKCNSVRESSSANARMAGVAALQRLENRNIPSMVNRSQNVIRAEACKELQEEAQREEPSTACIKSREVAEHATVLFKCPLIGSYVLPKKEMDDRIKSFLYEQLIEGPGLISCLIIKSCNKNQENVKVCVETLVKCLDNIMEHPEEEKFRKIRVKSASFQTKILPIEGSLEFLQAIGFERQLLPHTNDEEEEFYVLPSDFTNFEEMQMLKDALITAEPIKPELDRNVKLVLSTHQLERIDLPDEFYRLSVEELKREQQYRTEALEKSLMLRTKAMRERDSVRSQGLYRYCFIRVRFPNNQILQGTFKTWEKLFHVKEFLKEHVIDENMPFVLSTSNGQRLHESDLTLAELGLVPAVVINFSWDVDVGVSQTNSQVEYLKKETLAICNEV